MIWPWVRMASVVVAASEDVAWHRGLVEQLVRVQRIRSLDCPGISSSSTPVRQAGSTCACSAVIVSVRAAETAFGVGNDAGRPRPGPRSAR